MDSWVENERKILLNLKRRYPNGDIILSSMNEYNGECSACKNSIMQSTTGEPYLPFKKINLCSDCYCNLILAIYHMAGSGDGGIIHILFKSCLLDKHNRKKRIPISKYKETFQKLLHKYNFRCVACGEEERKKLTIDHIIPVAKNGTDNFSNLQILCRTCNSKKGIKYG